MNRPGRWVDDARCAGRDPDQFYPFKRGPAGHDDETECAKAARVCFACPVRVDCLEHALATDERYGVWGGASVPQRQKMRKFIGPLDVREVAELYARHGNTHWMVR